MSTLSEQAGDALERRYGSDLVETSVHRTDGALRWQHRVHGESFEAAHARARAVRTLCDPASAGLTVGVWRGDVWTYRATSARTLADVVLDGECGPDWAPTLEQVGRSLAYLHGLHLSGDRLGLGPSPSLVRLQTWFRGLADEFAASHFAPVAREVLGGEQWQRLASWCDELLATGDEVLCHGAVGSGVVLVGDASQEATLLTGPALCLARPQTDLGHIAGELLEVWAHGRVDESALRVLLAAFCEGYGRPLTLADHRAAVLRIVLHQRDYVGTFARRVTPDVLSTLRFVRFLVDSDLGGLP